MSACSGAASGGHHSNTDGLGHSEGDVAAGEERPDVLRNYSRH